MKKFGVIVGILLFLLLQNQVAFAGGGMHFDQLNWSPDSRYLAFSFDFVFDNDEFRVTEGHLGFYDQKRDLAWSPHEGVSLQVEEFDTTYVANRLGIFSVPSKGGVWKVLLGPETFINKYGGPSNYFQKTFLKYDPESKILSCIIFEINFHSDKIPALVQLQLPEGNLVKIEYMEGSPYSTSNRFNEDYLNLLKRFQIELPPVSDHWQPDKKAKSNGVMITDVEPSLQNLWTNKIDFLWTPPNTLLLRKIGTPISSKRPFSQNLNQSVTLKIPPAGIISQIEKTDEQIIDTSWPGYHVDWDSEKNKMPELKRYRIQVLGNMPWKISPPSVVVLDSAGEPTEIQHILTTETKGKLPTHCINNFSHTEDQPGPGAKVCLFADYEKDESSFGGYFADLSEATQFFFKDYKEAEKFARKITPFLKEEVSKKKDETFSGDLICDIDPLDFKQAKGLAKSGDYWYVILLNRLWRINLQTNYVELVHLYPLYHYAVSPDKKFIAAACNQFYGAMQLIIFDLESNKIRKILPPEDNIED